MWNKTGTFSNKFNGGEDLKISSTKNSMEKLRSYQPKNKYSNRSLTSSSKLNIRNISQFYRSKNDSFFKNELRNSINLENR